MIIRKYNESDFNQIANIFYETITNICSKDYSKEQISAWAKGPLEPQKYLDRFQNEEVYVCVMDDVICGYITKNNDYIDHLYVHKDYLNMNVATFLCDYIEKLFKKEIYVVSSITALGFFLKRGYQILNKQEVIRNNIILTNYKLIKYL